MSSNMDFEQENTQGFDSSADDNEDGYDASLYDDSDDESEDEFEDYEDFGSDEDDESDEEFEDFVSDDDGESEDESEDESGDYDDFASDDDADEDDFSAESEDEDEDDFSAESEDGDDFSAESEDEDEDDFSAESEDGDDFSAESEDEDEDDFSSDDDDEYDESSDDDFSSEGEDDEQGYDDSLEDEDEGDFSSDDDDENEDDFSSDDDDENGEDEGDFSSDEDEDEDDFDSGEDGDFDDDVEMPVDLDNLDDSEDTDMGFSDSDSDEDEDEDEERPSAVSQMSDSMKAEYDAAFSDVEKVNNLLKITRDKFNITYGIIDMADIATTEPAKRSRKRTIIGLTQSIRDLGVVTPIHVLKVAEEDATEGYRYILIDGLRRMFGAIKNNMTTIPAEIWDFKNKDKGMDLALPLGLMINRQQRRQWSETWDTMRILELQSDVTPGTLEFLLQLEGGEAMKLKDVMLCDYSEVKELLLSGEKDLEACYKMLQKLRKEEDQLAKDDATGFGDTVEDAGDVTTDVSEGEGQLSDNDVMELLEMAESLDSDEVNETDFNDMVTPDSDFVDAQKVGERHPLDPALRQAVLARDDFTCACCGKRMVGVAMAQVAVHHIIPVHCHGRDELTNLITLCVGCHINLHCCERNGGSIMMSKEDFCNLVPSEQTALKRALRLARVAIEADKRQGLSKEQVHKATSSAIRHPMPGVGLKETQAMYNATRAQRASANDDGEDE